MSQLGRHAAPDFGFRMQTAMAGQFLNCEGSSLMGIFSRNFIGNTARHDSPDFSAEENFQRNLKSLVVNIVCHGLLVVVINRNGTA